MQARLIPEDWLFIPIICYVPYIMVFVASDNGLSFSAGFVITIIGFLLTWLSYEKRKSRIKNNIPQNVREIPRDNPVLILGAIYGIVAAFAITQALTTTFGQPESSIQTNHVLILISFFLVAIPFYHGATVFLTTRAAELIHDKKYREIFFSFIMLFIEAAFLYLMAISVGSIERFMLWLIALMIVDVLWILVDYRKIGWVLLDYRKINDATIPPEWIHLDFFIIGFLAIVLSSHLFLEPSSYLSLLILLCIRTLVDYRVAWNLVYFRIRG